MQSLKTSVPASPASAGPILSDRFLNIGTLCRELNLSRSGIYFLIKRNRFPKPHKLSARKSGWAQSAVEQWIAERKAA